MTPPSHASAYGEDALVEQPAIALFADLGWDTGNLYGEWASGASTAGRTSDRDVFLVPRLRAALATLNPDLPASALDQAIEELTRDRSRMVPVNANAAVYRLLKDGVTVEVADDQGKIVTATVRLIEWRDPTANDFFLASQFRVRGDLYRRRADLVGFVNGIPLLFLELKASHKTLKTAYDDNLTDYRAAIPALFVPNGFVMLSNGSQTRLGGTDSPWEHFFEWKRINDEGEQGVVSLDTAIRGTCTRERLLDIVENFTVFEDGTGGLIKKIARNHQFLGVTKALDAVSTVRDRPEAEAGRLGVFWHTQGSGKSLSMLFFTQKLLRTVPGNWTFVIVTDRDELDGQIHKTFVNTGAVTETKAHATSTRKLNQLLRENHRYVFTLIHKFREPDGYPLSTRRDIIVIADEAHRSQYDTLALNMRAALPNAAFLGFTGTPLMAGEERTKDVFGDYVSIYSFAQSIADGATVPLFYENRIPELQLTNQDLNTDLEALLEDAELDADQERKVEQVFARQYHLITREDRLEAVAADLVRHLAGRGYQGKAMMVCIDKATAVRMHDKVRARWAGMTERLKADLATVSGDEREALEERIARMDATDMAVVVSQGQNEEKQLRDKGLDIRPHRKRIIEEDLEKKFKDADGPLRLVFVCAMWITGFDVPPCSTIYLDKPMKNHTLMQTIARANRRHADKEAGLIVDYVGVFRKLQAALAIYGGATGAGSGDTPIRDKAELVDHLKLLVARAIAFCTERDIDMDAIQKAKGFEKIKLLDDAIEALIASDQDKTAFIGMARDVSRVFKAILPDPAASDIAPEAVLISILARKIRALTDPSDISGVMQQVEDLLDRSVAPVPYRIEGDKEEPLVDLSRIDFGKLTEAFATGRKRTEAEKLRALLSQKLEAMVARNGSRADFMERFMRLIEAYNSGSQNIQGFFDDLVRLAQALTREEQRAIREGLTEEELALFDILTRPEPTLTDKERDQVKQVCKALLEILKAEKLVLDWRHKPQARSAVLLAIKKTFDDGLPEIYIEDLYTTKCKAAFAHVFSSYGGGGESVYAL